MDFLKVVADPPFMKRALSLESTSTEKVNTRKRCRFLLVVVLRCQYIYLQLGNKVNASVLGMHE